MIFYHATNPYGAIRLWLLGTMSLQAASSGLGVAIASAFMVESDLQDGRLVAPFGFIADGSEYVVLSPLPVHQDVRRIALLDWFRGTMGLRHLTR